MISPQNLLEPLWEGELRSREAWNERLEISDTQLSALIADGILSRTQTSGTGETYRLELVGVLFTQARSFVALPKIFRRNSCDHLAVAHDVISCLRIYLNGLRKRESSAQASEISSALSGGRAIDLFLALLDWTLDHGLQSEDFETQDENLLDIDWSRTLDRGIPLHTGKSIVYSEVHGRTVAAQTGPLASLQARGLTRLHRQLMPTSELWISQHDPILESAHALLSSQTDIDQFRVSNTEELIDYIDACNRDHDRDLAALLYQWLTDSIDSPLHPRAFGTTSFHFVWEDVCRKIFQGLGEPLIHDAIASQPIYRLGELIIQSDTQRPDILRTASGKVHVIDAKWYDAAHQELPRTPDIIKQLMYQLTISNVVPVGVNMFLLPHPTLESSFKRIGTTLLASSGKPDDRFPSINIVAINWSEAVSVYCGKRPAHLIARDLLGIESNENM